jgi:transcriptional regulator with XRE-family HTH domain
VNFNEDLDHIAATFGARLRAFREEHGLSQNDVAERTGIAREQINRYETGIPMPTLKNFAILVRFMDADAHQMLFGDEEREDMNILMRDRSLMRCWIAIAKLDTASRRWFVDLALAGLQNGRAATRAQLEKLYEEG